MRNSCGCTRVRGGTHAGLVREQTALHAPNNGAHRAAHYELAQTESTLENHEQNVRNFAHIEHNHEQPQQHVQNRHERHHKLGDRRNGADTAEDNRSRQCGNEKAYHDAETHILGTGNTDIQGVRTSFHDRIGLYRAENKTIGEHDKAHENQAQPACIQATLHIVGRTANIGILAAFFIQLTQQGFGKSGCTAHGSNDPHPEHRAGTTHCNSDRYASNIAGAHAGCRRNGERAE